MQKVQHIANAAPGLLLIAAMVLFAYQTVSIVQTVEVGRRAGAELSRTLAAQAAGEFRTWVSLTAAALVSGTDTSVATGGKTAMPERLGAWLLPRPFWVFRFADLLGEHRCLERSDGCLAENALIEQVPGLFLRRDPGPSVILLAGASGERMLAVAGVVTMPGDRRELRVAVFPFAAVAVTVMADHTRLGVWRIVDTAGKTLAESSADRHPAALGGSARVRVPELKIALEFRLRDWDMAGTTAAGFWWATLGGTAFLAAALIFLLQVVVRERIRVQTMSATNAGLRTYGEQLEVMVKNQTHDLQVSRERAEELARLKTEFITTVSHEIRTPLNGIIGFAELLGETPLTEQQQECAVTILESGRSLLSLVEHVVDFSSLEKGMVTLESKPFNPRRVIDDLWRSYRRQAEHRQLVLHGDPGDLPTEALGDSRRLAQAIGNLVDNALKFTSAGGNVRVSGRLEATTPTHFRLHFTVSDSGMGIPADRLPTLFEPLRQVDGSFTRRGEGPGLGLAITRRLVNMMGGEVDVRSQSGQGTAFSLTVTVVRPSDHV